MNFSPEAGLEYARRGDAAFAAHRPAEALAWFEAALKFRETDASWIYNRGVARWQLSDTAGALQDIETAAAREPGVLLYRQQAQALRNYLHSLPDAIASPGTRP